jgi:hypothetical protein
LGKKYENLQLHVSDRQGNPLRQWIRPVGLPLTVLEAFGWLLGDLDGWRLGRGAAWPGVYVYVCMCVCEGMYEGVGRLGECLGAWIWGVSESAIAAVGKVLAMGGVCEC